jgi:hypothetical protein
VSVNEKKWLVLSLLCILVSWVGFVRWVDGMMCNVGPGGMMLNRAGYPHILMR